MNKHQLAEKRALEAAEQRAREAGSLKKSLEESTDCSKQRKNKEK